MDVVAAKAGERDSKTNRETVLRDFVRFAWRATRGLTSAAEAESRDMVHQMAASGRITKEEGERLLTTLLWRMKGSRQTFEARVNASVERAIEKLADVSTKELQRLSGQAVELEKRLDHWVVRKRGK